ncbi:MAG TPA: hypothetical protein GX506_04545, partial [Firmicutes bacterium]|nr:hypothetical protein [Bacillota bacterium]
MRDVIRYGVVLALICTVAAGVLAYVNDITEEKIAAQKALEEERALAGALPGATDFKDKTADISNLLSRPEFNLVKGYYLGYSGDRLVGA